MAEVEKMEALKKVYADVLFNTAREASVRIVASERKAFRFQQEVFAAKNEALNMILHLKIMMDNKIANAETSSSIQRKKIDELEAQLNEAEEIVRDLRVELTSVQNELAKMKRYIVQDSDEQAIKASGNSDFLSPDYMLDTPVSNLLPPTISVAWPVSTSDMKDAPSNNKGPHDNCLRVSENATITTATWNDSPKDNYNACGPDFPSIIRKSQKPELYRYRCTQRILALNRKLLPLGKKVSVMPLTKNGSIIKNKSNEGILSVTLGEGEDVGLLQKKDGLKELLQQDSSCDKNQTTEFTPIVSSGQGKYGSRYITTTLCMDQVIKVSEQLNISCCKDKLKITEEEAHKNSELHVGSVSSVNTTNLDPSSGCKDDIGAVAKSFKARTSQNYTDKDNSDTENSEVPLCKLTALVDSCLEDDQKCEMASQAPEATNDKYLKYTFQRKRKKEFLSRSGENVSPVKASKRSLCVNEKDTLESKTSTLIIESRDSSKLCRLLVK
ncbi:hypothetical protein GIB67_004238 [Kingdonia uniflora]|uniref:Uncharacterized protein n=1 Tax=Kingdonia uniflora TaxID=39325 RepID=A0A7J7MR72_9MAGN|nr:hypothetical protein GIB67_004238 [Kingdonia uniflora]